MTFKIITKNGKGNYNCYTMENALAWQKMKNALRQDGFTLWNETSTWDNMGELCEIKSIFRKEA